jgi:hypothetical protein
MASPLATTQTGRARDLVGGSTIGWAGAPRILNKVQDLSKRLRLRRTPSCSVPRWPIDDGERLDISGNGLWAGLEGTRKNVCERARSRAWRGSRRVTRARLRLPHGRRGTTHIRVVWNLALLSRRLMMAPRGTLAPSTPMAEGEMDQAAGAFCAALDETEEALAIVRRRALAARGESRPRAVSSPWPA